MPTTSTGQFYPQGPFGTTFWGGYWTPNLDIVQLDVLGALQLDAEPLGYGSIRLRWTRLRLLDRTGFDGTTVPNPAGGAFFTSASANFIPADTGKRITGTYIRPDTYVTYIDEMTVSLSLPVNDYGSNLAWQLFNTFDRYLLVRNRYGYPDTPSDGIVVLLGYAGDNVLEFIDGDLRPGFYYYTLFIGLTGGVTSYGP